MLIKTLTLNNFRVFKGEHVVPLSSGLSTAGRKNVVLFGGMNGAGKTSILTAVRLALYGRSSTGTNVSKKTYHEMLRSFIHREPKATDKAGHASVQIEFTYDKRDYSVTRQWTADDNTIVEQLTLLRDGTTLDELTPEQCQAFLDQLIPIGVANLFFFDGEKISELAEEDGSNALALAIHQMLGLKYFDKLRSDVGHLIRTELRSNETGTEKRSIKDLHARFVTERHELQAEKEVIAQKEDTLSIVNAEIKHTENIIDQLGGAWATTRSAAKSELTSLETLQHKESNELRHKLDGKFALIFAPQKLKALAKKLETQKKRKAEATVAVAVGNTVKDIAHQLEQNGLASPDILTVINSFSPDVPDIEEAFAYDVPDRILGEIQNFCQTDILNRRQEVSAKLDSLLDLENRIASLEENLGRAPDEAQLKDHFEKLTSLTKRKASLESEILTGKLELKRKLKDLIGLGKEIQASEHKLIQEHKDNTKLQLAQNVRSIAKDFVKQSMANKARALEAEFLIAFRKLARKDDLLISVHIDPESYAVKIVDEAGRTVSKDQMSAGERQIYAIAMLEALGVLTGWELPVIIDTPLGRLDSAHRQKLVEHYFPRASHQVIILSTDTEIDEDFARNLNPYIASSYHIDFDAAAQNSKIEPGYFWATKTTKEDNYVA